MKHLLKNRTEVKNLLFKDDKAFELIYKKFWDSLYGTAYNRLNSHEAVEEILQDLFTDLWSRREGLYIKVSARAYLHAALKYKIINYLYSKNVRNTVGFDNPEFIAKPDDSTRAILAFEDLYESLQKGLEKLPKKCSLVFRMSREEQKSSKEIAKKLNISHRTVQTHIHNALKILKVELADYRVIIPFVLTFL